MGVDLKERTVEPVQVEDAVKKLFSAKEGEYDEKKLFPIISYQYEQYSIDELVIIARTDWFAREEYLGRIATLIVKISVCLCKSNKYIRFSDVYMHLQTAGIRAMKMFDPSFQKPFIHLFRGIMKMTAKVIESEEARRYFKEVKVKGLRINPTKSLMFFDRVDDSQPDFSEIIMKVDAESFMETLKPKQREIFFMFYHGYSNKEISDALRISYSSVIYWIRKLINSAKTYFGY